MTTPSVASTPPIGRPYPTWASAIIAPPTACGHNVVVAIPGTNDVMRFDVQMHFVQGTTAATVERSKAEKVAGAAKGAEADGVGGEAEDAVRDATFDPAAGRGRLAAYEGTLAPAVRTVLRASRAKDDSDGNPFASLPEACVAAILRELANLPEYAPRVHCVLHWRWGGGYGAGRSRCSQGNGAGGRRGSSWTGGGGVGSW